MSHRFYGPNVQVKLSLGMLLMCMGEVEELFCCFLTVTPDDGQWLASCSGQLTPCSVQADVSARPDRKAMKVNSSNVWNKTRTAAIVVVASAFRYSSLNLVLVSCSNRPINTFLEVLPSVIRRHSLSVLGRRGRCPIQQGFTQSETTRCSRCTTWNRDSSVHIHTRPIRCTYR